jgi:BTB/POZ domain
MGQIATVCAADSDLTFLSNDNVLFKVHRKNLEILSGGFAAPAMVSGEGEVVRLVEPAAVLELLFQYLYPQRRQPNLQLVEFELLNGLVEAVEKYQVYPALDHCKTFMQCVNSCYRIDRI